MQPGVQDSNAARSAVAGKYMEKCTGLWVVAPITRAVDDRTAHRIMCGSFGRQLQLDGTYSTVSFICSKTDDITVSEILSTMAEGDPAHQFFQEQKILEDAIDVKGEERSKLDDRVESEDRSLDDLNTELRSIREALRSQPADTEILTITTPKRKQLVPKVTPSAASRKRKRRLDSDSDESESDSTLSQEMDTVTISTPDAKQRFDEKIDMRETLEQSRNHSKALKRTVNKDLKALRARKKRLADQTKSACIKYRNEYARPAIKRQFSDAIRE